MHRVGSTYGCRPSVILGVTDDWVAYQLDVACMMVGVTEDARIAEEAQQPGKGRRAAPQATGQRKFTSLGHMARPVKIREDDGGWDD